MRTRTLLAAAAIGLALAGCSHVGQDRATTPVNATTETIDPGVVDPPTPVATSSAAPRTASVGDTVAFTNGPTAGTITLNGVRSMPQTEGPFGGPSENGTFLVADLTMSITAGTMSANPLWFQASTADGTTHQAELGALENQFPSQDVVAGRQVRGEVTFDVPTGQPLLLDFVFAGGPPLATFGIPAQ